MYFREFLSLQDAIAFLLGTMRESSEGFVNVTFNSMHDIEVNHEPYDNYFWGDWRIGRKNISPSS